MTPDLVLVEQADLAVQIITLNRPEKRNALSVAMIEALREAVVGARADSNCRVIILRGRPPAFCAGLDLEEAADPQHSDRSAHALAALYEAVATSPTLTIAAAAGAALGGGAGLVAACDFAVAGDDLRLGFPEVHRGLVAALVTCLLRRQVSDRQLRELILLGQTLDSARAFELRLVNQVVPVGQLDEAAMKLARQALTGAPGAIARSKRLLDDLSARPIREDLSRALAYHLKARDSEEAAEGIAAFRQRRQPVWPPRSAAE
jgi:methylglutaconyl-CoA hydratase